MKKIVHNKLVRDHIPEIIEADHKQCKTSILSEEGYIKELKKNFVKKQKK